MAQDPFKYFRVEANELVDQLGKGVLELERSGTGVLPKLLRLAHTLKGAARVVRRPDIAEHAHAIEDQLASWSSMAWACSAMSGRRTTRAAPFSVWARRNSLGSTPVPLRSSSRTPFP